MLTLAISHGLFALGLAAYGVWAYRKLQKYRRVGAKSERRKALAQHALAFAVPTATITLGSSLFWWYHWFMQ